MRASVFDGGTVALTTALERKRAELHELIASRHDDRSFREGMQKGVEHYRAYAALLDLQLAQLKRDYARGTQEHIREVNAFLSSNASQDEFELRDMLRFVLGLLGHYVFLVEHQSEEQLASALRCLDPQDFSHA